MRLVNADKLEEDMYHNAFEIDTDLQKWDSGCWIRYKMFEHVIDEQPTVEAIPIGWIEELSAKLKEEDSFEKAMFLLDMIDVWEEENGNRRMRGGL